MLVGLLLAATQAAISAEPAAPAADPWELPEQAQVASQWNGAQKARALESMKFQAFDVLVVPIQAGRDSFDSRGRAIMTFSLAEAIAARTDLRVADPGVIARYFGGTARQIDDAAIDSLAAKLRVSRVLVGTVAQDGEGEYALRMRTFTYARPGVSDSKQPEQVKTYSGNPYSDAAPPAIGFPELRDEVLEDSGIRLRKQRTQAAGREPAGLPETVDELTSPATAEDAVMSLQLLGVLVPPEIASFTRDQLFGRSVALLEQLKPNASVRKMLLARAMLYLGRRPAAVAILGEPRNAAERALLAYTNGNLEALAAAVEDMPPGLLATVATIEKERLRQEYYQKFDPELAEHTLENEPLWGPLLVHAMIDGDDWRPHSHALLKVSLDTLYPVKRLGLEALYTGMLSVGGAPEEFDIASALFEHLAEVEADAPEPAASGPAQVFGPHVDDVTDIFRDLLVGDVYSESNHRAVNIGKPRSALELLERYELLLADHPALVGRQLQAYRYLGNKASDVEKANINSRILSLARRTIELNGGLTEDTVDFSRAGRQLYPELTFDTPAGYDRLLFRSDWPQPPGTRVTRASTEERRQQFRHCLDYTRTNLRCLTELFDVELTLVSNPGDEEGVARLLEDNADRFVGHPDRIEFTAQALRRLEGEGGAERVYLAAIDAGTTQWTPYEEVGRSQFRLSNFDEALKTVLRFPGLQDVGLEGAVAQSNRAYDFGSLFYWAGAYEQALPLYEIAAATGTGSGAEMSSAQRLALVDGDYELAQYHSSRRIRRYQDKYAVRDLIGLSTIAGNTEQAWSLIDGFQPMFDKPEPWVGALIAHRADNRDIDSIAEWGFEDGRENLGDGKGVLSMRFAFLAYTLDRTPSADFPEALRARQDRVRSKSRGVVMMIGAESPYFLARHYDMFRTDLNVKPEDRFMFGAEAMVAIEERDYRTAYSLLDQAANHYALREFLPLYAWAAAKTGQTQKIEGYLDGARRFMRGLPDQSGYPDKLFDENLADAMLKGAKGQVDDAIALLKAANTEIVHNTDRNILTRYQIIELARVLWEDTGDQAYRDFALDLARRNAVIEPIQAYAHSFVAMLSPDRKERTTALARVLVLDPQSRCIGLADANEVADAQRLAAKGYPMPGRALLASI